MADSQDHPLIRELVDVAWDELDRQHLEGVGDLYVDAVLGSIEGQPNMFKVVEAVVDALWAEEGR